VKGFIAGFIALLNVVAWTLVLILYLCGLELHKGIIIAAFIYVIIDSALTLLLRRCRK
jgi:hypothetical protein